MSIKQSTNTTVIVGPIINTDGEPVTTFVLGQSHIKLSKNGSAFANKNSAATFTHNASGWYSGLLNQTDTDTCGELTLMINKSGSLPYWTMYNVLPANVYDSLIGNTDYLDIDMKPATLSKIVASGNAATWAADTTNVTVIDINPYSLSKIVSSGNAGGWNTVTSLTGVYNSLRTISGFTDTLETLVSARPTITTIITSGTTAGWANNTTSVTVTGINPYVLSRIVTSGNAANWDATLSQVTVSGITKTVLSQIITSGNVAGWANNATSVTVTGISPNVLGRIILSGNAASWNASATVTGIWGYSTRTLTGKVATSGLTPIELNDIITSGNAAGWNAAVSASGINAIVSGVAEGVGSGIWSYVVDGATASDALKYILAYATGNVSRTGTTYTYASYDGTTTRLSIVGTNNGKTVTKS